MWHPHLHIPPRIDSSGKAKPITVSVTPHDLAQLNQLCDSLKVNRSAAIRILINYGNDNLSSLSHSRYAAKAQARELYRRNKQTSDTPPRGSVNPPLPQQAPNLHRSGACQFEERSDHHQPDEPTGPIHEKPTL